MTTAEQIINNCKKGLITIVQDDTENYIAFSNHKDYDGNYRTSDWSKTIKEAKRCIGEREGFSEEKIEEYSKEHKWKIVEVYREEVEPFKVGDKVKMLPSINGANNWTALDSFCFLNREGEIEEVNNERSGLYYKVKYGDGFWFIEHKYLTPSDEEEIIKIGDKKYNKSEVEEALKNIKPLQTKKN